MQFQQDFETNIFFQKYYVNKCTYIKSSFIDDNHPYLHYHDNFEIGYVLHGSGTFIIGNNTFSFNTGDISIVKPNEMHITNSIHESDSEWSYFVIDAQSIFERDIMGQMLISNLGSTHGSVIRENDEPRLSQLFNLMADEYTHFENNDCELFSILFHELLLRFIRYNERQNTIVKGSVTKEAEMSNFQLLAPALEYIISHYDTQIEIPFLADLCHMSNTNFRCVFKKGTGCSPLKYITMIRMYAASAMLNDKYKSITNIAYQTGYLSLSSFYRHFCSYYGITPSEYRKKLTGHLQKA